ncbi:MAG: oligopeptide:H+ symporter [Rickettsiales bacterium]
MEKINTNIKIPKFLWLLGFVEMWERFSYYGMRALLVLYLISALKMSDTDAYSIYGIFGTFAYIGCVAFGYLSDKFIGARNTVKIGAITMLFGHILMAISHVEAYSYFVYMALSLICIGTSAFKGNITNMLGLCYKNSPYNKDAGYTMFYVFINVGSFFASLICGYLGINYGWGWGFGIAALGMFIGLVILQMFEYLLGTAGNMPDQYKANKVSILSSFVFGLIAYAIIFSYMIQYAGIIMQERFEITSTLKINVLEAIFPFIIFWYGFDAFKDKEYRKNLFLMFVFTFCTGMFYIMEMQIGGMLKVFVDRCVDLNVYIPILGIKIESSMVESINPGVIMLFGSAIGMSKVKENQNSIYRFLLGLASIPMCFLVLYMGCKMHNAGMVAFSFLFWAFTIMSIGEVFVGPFAQSQISKLSNPNKRGISFGFFMFFLGLSNVIGARIAKTLSIDPETLTDPIATLLVYEKGFIDIIIWNAWFIGIFVVCIPMLKNLYKKVTFQKADKIVAD